MVSPTSLILFLSGIYEIDHGRMQQNHTDDKSTLGQVNAWCLQATGHYLSQMLALKRDDAICQP